MITKKEKYLIICIIALMIVLVGAFMNFKAIQYNNGKMPVFYQGYITSNQHFAFQDFNEIKYSYLSDIIPIGKRQIISIGDILLVSGGLIFAISLSFWRFK